MIKKFKNIIILVMSALTGFSQTLSPTVINSTGEYFQNGTMSLSYSVGEPVVETFGAGTYFFTQGFQQPLVIPAVALTATVLRNNTSCLGETDGTAQVQIFTGTPPYNFNWSHDSTLNSATADNLPPGSYSVLVTDANSKIFSDSLTIFEGTGICDIRVYTGITPNGDGSNDSWVIDNIDLYPENNVAIFNRWGQKVWSAEKYDNINVIWKGDNQAGQLLPDATYYYLITTDRGEQKGWVELTR